MTTLLLPAKYQLGTRLIIELRSDVQALGLVSW